MGSRYASVTVRLSIPFLSLSFPIDPFLLHPSSFLFLLLFRILSFFSLFSFSYFHSFMSLPSFSFFPFSSFCLPWLGAPLFVATTLIVWLFARSAHTLLTLHC